MKKKLLLFLFLLMSTMSVSAVDWNRVDTDIPNFTLYIDKDSIKYINAQECLYAIKFQSGQKPEKVVFLKSNSYTNHLGVIRVEEYNYDYYRPNAVFANVHVYMKPIESNSFLTYAHKYVSTLISSESNAKKVEEIPQKDAFTPIAPKVIEGKPVLREDKKAVVLPAKPKEQIIDHKPSQFQKQTTATDLKAYVKEVSTILNKNWFPPKSKIDKQAIAILTIGKDGSLQKYYMAKSSGDDLTDRSIINAVKKSVPYPKFPKLDKPSDVIKLQFVFDCSRFKKSVI